MSRCHSKKNTEWQRDIGLMQQCIRGPRVSNVRYTNAYYCTDNFLQVAVLAPLALLLVLEDRCIHFVIAHFNYFVCCGVVITSSYTAHIHVYMMTNL